ncbi:hypothetical protein [Burkholderia cepacia]|uniref:hypothetical protein n=1 Tax=Burkholderia cepacia TaxID=292 RepID=UPI0009BDD869|nr:hypothetical protein [Burkholderia cepacia]
MTPQTSTLPAATAPSPSSGTLVQFTVSEPLEVHFYSSSVVSALGAFVAIALILWPLARNWRYLKSFEIDQAEIGIGSQKVKLTPNDVDRQIAYKIWVELSTRKIGLPIDLEHDVIIEVYDSWHTFFSVTRELIKDIPVNKYRRKDTEQIVRLSIAVLNEGLRPHLTTWQARFRRWYDRGVTDTALIEQAPQDIQKQFPQYAALSTDLLAVNERLIAYRKIMSDLVLAK